MLTAGSGRIVMDLSKEFYFYLCDVWREFMLLVEQNFQEFGEPVVLWA
jgi:hypothetical protein